MAHTNQHLTIRSYRPSDTPHLIAIFRNAMHTIVSRDYNAEQITAFAPKDIDAHKWQAKLENSTTFVAEYGDSIVGFANITRDGYFGHLYIDPRYQGGKVSLRLFKEIERVARELGLQKITTHCSITAKIPAQRMGFVVVKENQGTRNGVAFINYVMEKKL